MTIASLVPWLPAVAAGLLSMGCNGGERPGPDSAATAPPRDGTGPWFREAAMERGIDFVHESGHGEPYLMPEIMAGGAALFDMDGDGDLDAYLVQGGSLKGAPRHFNQLYRNDGSGRFENATAGSGSGDGGYGMGVATGDYDGDGDTDLYVTNVGANALLQNDGPGSFTDVTAPARVGDRSWGAGAAFLDYDGDGDLDLFAANYIDWSLEARKECANSLGGPDYCSPRDYNAPARDLLYRNNGDGTFDDVSAAAGLDAAFGNGLGVVCGDFDGDGRTDIFVANDSVMNQLWMNRGDGTFADEALLRGCALDEGGIAKAGMGVSAVDVDDNATLDLLVVNLESETDSFYRNQGTYFTDATAAAGLAWGSHLYTRFGVGILDFDNDGRLDLYAANGRIDRGSSAVRAGDPFAEPNLLLSGRPDGRFEEVLPRGGDLRPSCGDEPGGGLRRRGRRRRHRRAGGQSRRARPPAAQPGPRQGRVDCIPGAQRARQRRPGGNGHLCRGGCQKDPRSQDGLQLSRRQRSAHPRGAGLRRGSLRGGGALARWSQRELRGVRGRPHRHSAAGQRDRRGGGVKAAGIIVAPG